MSGELLPLLLKGTRHRLWQQPGLLDQVKDVLRKLHDARDQSRATCTMPSGRWQQMPGAAKAQVTKRQQVGAVSGETAPHLLSLLA